MTLLLVVCVSGGGNYFLLLLVMVEPPASDQQGEHNPIRDHYRLAEKQARSSVHLIHSARDVVHQTSDECCN